MFKRGNILSEWGFWLAIGIVAFVIIMVAYGIATGRSFGIIDKINAVIKGLFGF